MPKSQGGYLKTFKYLASFYIGETEGSENFQILESTQYVLDNWESKANARLSFENLEIECTSIHENTVFDDDDGTYLFYLDCEFEIDGDQKKLLKSAYEFDVPMPELFSLDCGKYAFTCGVVEESDL